MRAKGRKADDGRMTHARARFLAFKTTEGAVTDSVTDIVLTPSDGGSR